MTVAVSLSSLLAYSDCERKKWRDWLEANPARLRLPFQPKGRFSDVAALFDHVFLIERRHLSRLEGAVPPTATGIAPDDVAALFDYADLVRADFRAYLDACDETLAGQPIVLTGLQSSGDITMSRRRLATHILLHEIRHLAQIAYAARLAGHEPPGQHDIFYFGEFV